jgi:hypothetical protein
VLSEASISGIARTSKRPATANRLLPRIAAGSKRSLFPNLKSGHISLFLLNFWTDAFGQLHEGSGRAVDGKAADLGWMA